MPSCNLPRSTIETSKQESGKQTARKSREERRVKREKNKNRVPYPIKNKESQVTDLNGFSEVTDNLNSKLNFGKTDRTEKEEESNNSICNNVENNVVLSNNVEDNATILNNVEDNATILNKPVTVDIGILVKSGDLMELNFSAFIKTEKDLSTVTGIPTFKILGTLVAIVERVAPRLSFYSGKITVRDRIILTFIKLKQNLSYAFLAVLFKAFSERHISNVVCNMIDILGNTLKHAIM